MNVNINVNANANANASASARVNARAGSTVVVGGGGGAYFSSTPRYPTTIQGLNVEGGLIRETIRVPYTATRRYRKRVVIQAVCIDDRNVPHPASQTRGDREVFEDFEGELYRCLSGSWLQITISEYEGESRSDHGETIVCRKGEALWYGGRESRIECRPQRPERDCNERSLLRRYGAGVKILTLYREETYTEYREEIVEVEGLAVSGSFLMLDGGVGSRGY